MPYIPSERRHSICSLGFDGGIGHPDTAGELNYWLTLACIEYLGHKGRSYQTINDIVGALEGAKLEFYRRIAAPYEDTKIKENGDVY